MLNAEKVLAGARSIVSFHPADLVRELVAYGEVEAAEKLMQRDAQAIIFLGIVEFLEGQSRPLNRKRRIYPKA